MVHFFVGSMSSQVAQFPLTTMSYPLTHLRAIFQYYLGVFGTI